jgi:hypothetical protein
MMILVCQGQASAHAILDVLCASERAGIVAQLMIDLVEDNIAGVAASRVRV